VDHLDPKSPAGFTLGAHPQTGGCFSVGTKESAYISVWTGGSGGLTGLLALNFFKGRRGA